MTTHEILMPFRDFSLGLQVDSQEADPLGADPNGGIEDASLHGEFLWAVVSINRIVGE